MSDLRDAVLRPVRRRAPEGIEKLARVGFAAKGVLYLLIGGLTAGAMVGATRHRVSDQKGAFARILEMPFGQVVLTILAAGLFGYAAWRIVMAIRDPEGHGTGAKGLAIRAVDLCKAAAHVGLGFAAARLVQGATKHGAGSDAHVRDWTATLMDAPFGVALVVAVGLGLLGYAGFQVYRAWSGKFLEPLSPPAGAREWVERAGRAGITARAVVFALIGVFLIRAATHANPAQAKGFGSALRSLEVQPHGPLLLGIVALGLAAYGLFELAEARYRRLPT